jgi:hypothetical protein
MKIVYLFLLCSLPAYAAFEFSLADANLSGLSGSTAASDQIYSAYLLNPAVTSALDHHHLGIQYFKPYGMSELYSGSLVSNIITSYFNSGVAVSTLGNEIYSENQLIINLSRGLLNQKFMIGLNLRWFSIQVKNYNPLNALGIDAGFQYRINSRLLMGFSLLNLNQPSFYQKKEELPSLINWGMQIRLTDQFTSFVSIQKDSWFSPSVRLGFSFWVNSFINLQSGFNSYPAIPAVGFHVQRNWAAFDYSLQYHFDLGITHFWGISLSKSVAYVKK